MLMMSARMRKQMHNAMTTQFITPHPYSARRAFFFQESLRLGWLCCDFEDLSALGITGVNV